MAIKLLTLALAILLSPLALGQEGASIFDPVDENQENEVNIRAPQRAENANVPALALRGTSRFGDVYKVSLVNTQNENKSIQVEWRANSAQQIEGYEGYRVVSVTSREARISLPEGQPCSPSTERGVTCSNNNNIMMLSLTTAEPLEGPAILTGNQTDPTDGGGAAEPADVGEEDEVFLTDDEGNLVLNPFSGEPQVVPQISEEERQAREERQRIRAARLQQFQPVRIPDSEVPPGMRKVSTPFGDRLVPEE